MVSIEQARQVGELAWKVATGDQETRRRLYEQRGLALDSTVS